ncbi:GAF domain-containing protein [Azospirillum sp.]|uniref:GAF domain-containing protein n=1 Tax=Azospirillum sp. TaxID=34012 RepID=UPI003D71135B
MPRTSTTPPFQRLYLHRTGTRLLGPGGAVRSDRLLDPAPSAEELLHQQAVLTDMGRLALLESDLDRLLGEACRLCAEGTRVPYAKLLELLPAEGQLVVRAGVGWSPRVYGRVRAAADLDNPCGRALREERPIVDVDVRRGGQGYHLPPIYDEYGIVSTINVAVMTDEGPFGVLEIDVEETRAFTVTDVTFMTAFANTLGDAITRIRRTAAAAATLAEAAARTATVRTLSATVDAANAAGAHLRLVVAPRLPDGGEADVVAVTAEPYAPETRSAELVVAFRPDALPPLPAREALLLDPVRKGGELRRGGQAEAVGESVAFASLGVTLPVETFFG